jgi:Tfp pilus assembly protein PilF
MPIVSRLRLRLLGAALLSTTALAGCASAPKAGPTAAAALPEPQAAMLRNLASSDHDGAQQHLARGVERLRAGDLKGASAEFNLGLKRDPQNAVLNYLNGYAYEEMARGGDVEKLDLAKVGYELALKFNPSLRPAAVQLGDIALERHDWGAAQEAFSQALEIDPADRDAAYGLAYASYYAGDVATAQAMMRRLPASSGEPAALLRARAIISAASGERAKAQLYETAYDAAEPDARRRSQLNGRVTSWGQTLDWIKPQLAEGAGAPQRFAQTQASPTQSQTPQLSPAPTPQELAPIKPEAPVGASPVPGQPPPDYEKMVIVDCIIIRREEVDSSSRGVNLLDGLNLQYAGTLVSSTASKTRDVTGRLITGGRTSSRSSVLGVPAVNYSLNIVNTQDSTSRIIGRPSIVAQDGEQSEFFMGSEVTYITSAGPSTYGSSFSKEVGLTLRVRPDFLPDGHIRLTVNAEFLAFEPVAAGTFSQALQTAKNRVRVVATMDYDKTLVIGGGSETLETAVNSGVPVLRSVPGLEYFFSKGTDSKTERSLLILMTPRRPLSPSQPTSVDSLVAHTPGGARVPPAELRELKSRYAAWFKPTSNLVEAMSSLVSTPLYAEFREGDLRLLDFDAQGHAHLLRRESRGQRLLKEALSTLYF